MAAPCYASTEWLGLGQANLRFRPKRKTTQPVDSVQIDCYLSAVYIREYGEKKKQKVNEEKTKEPQSDLKPPGIAPKVWTAWEEYWGAWKEVLIPLSWVHKYREHSTPDHIKWHDSYLEDYPDVVPLITDELGRSELSSDTTTCQSESTTDVVDYDYIYGEEKEQDDESSHELQEAVGGEAGTAAENECEPDKPGRKESNKGATKQSTENFQSADELDLTEFYDYIYPDETPENSQQHHAGEADKNGMVGANIRQEHASEGTADMNTAADTSKEEREEKRKRVLDELYERHTESRYWVHLRQFLHLSGIECHPEIELFYEQKAGIKFIQPSAKSCTGMTRDTEELSSVVHGELCSVVGEYHPEDKHSERRQKRKRKAKRKPEENCAEAPTSEERLQSILCVPQEADGSNLREENLKGDLGEEIKTTESETMDVEGGSSSGDGESVQAANPVTMNSASASSRNKQKKAKKGGKDTARPQGVSWALKHVKESKQAETTSKALEPQEVAAKTPEAASESVSRSPEAALGTPEAASGPSEPADKYLPADEEELAFAYFHNEMEEAERYHWKKYDKMLVEKASREFLQEKSTGLMTVCQVTVNKAATALHDLLLPLTAVHLLNMAFPGAAVMEYESSVTEEVPGERKKLKDRFDSFVYDEKIRLKRCLPKLVKFCLTTWTDAVVPVSLNHLTNLVFKNASEIEHKFPPDVFGVRWLPKPESSFQVDGKNVKRSQRRFYNWLGVLDPNLSPSATVELRGMVMNRTSHSDQDPRQPQRLYQQIVREEKEDATEGGGPCLTLHTLHLLQESSKTGLCAGDESSDGDWSSVQVTFDQDGYSGITNTDQTSQSTEDAKAKAEEEMWQRIILGCRRLAFFDTDTSMPSHLPQEIQKYWAQRYRLFLKYDEGIKLDTESWYSVTPELLAAHQARRCRCEVVVDALCGAGGNAIQLAKTCSHVIAIDKDPKKIELARHNAEVYGVAHRIDFRVGDFFKLAPSLKADVVYLSPPWGGMEYQEESVYNVYRLGGNMNCARLLRAARAITPNVALYLPRNSNLCQVIALAGAGGVVDIEANYMGPKKKAITAYFGDLATKTWWC